MIAMHLLQRIFGTMILAAPDPLEARAIVDRAESTLGWDDACLFCSIMLAVPAAIACARVGDLDQRPSPPRAAPSSRHCCGRARRGRPALAEAQAAVAAAEGRPDAARARLRRRPSSSSGPGNPSTPRRCRQALAAA